jgi:hypothetical protein
MEIKIRCPEDLIRLIDGGWEFPKGDSPTERRQTAEKLGLSEPVIGRLHRLQRNKGSHQFVQMLRAGKVSLE